MEPSNRSRIGIVIVNWNSGSLLKQCLESMKLCAARDRISCVVVVDNDSQDGSCDNLPPMDVTLNVIRNDCNHGFAKACNQGAALCAELAGPDDYVLFLNPDSELLPNSLSGPLAFMDDPSQQNVGICGIQLLDERERVARSCSRLPTFFSLITMALRLHGFSKRLFPPHFMKEWDHSTTRVVDQVIGAFFVVRSRLFQQLQGFDERFFVYYEEVDVCERTRQLGMQTVYLATAQARHVGGGCSNQVRGRSLFYSLRSRLAYADKHLNWWQSKLVRFSTMVFEPLIRMFFAAIKLKGRNFGQLAYAFGLLWRDQITPAGSASRSPSANAPSYADEKVISNNPYDRRARRAA